MRLTKAFGLFIPRMWVRGAALVAFLALFAAFLPLGEQGLVATGMGSLLLGGMIMDELLEFCDATALNTGAADTYLIGDVINLGSAGRDIGNGRTVYLVITVDTDVDSAGDGVTLAFTLASDAQAAIADDGTATEHIVTEAIPQATLVAGYKRVLPLPVMDYEQFLGILQTTAVEAVTAGKINAFLTLDPHGNKAYPDAL